MTRASSILRDPAGLLPNLLAIGYAVAGYAAGLWAITAGPWWVSAPGAILLGHAMVIAAYLTHEAAHMTVFRRPRHNRVLGEAMGWITGAGYASFDRIRHMHLRHHQDRADVGCFDYQDFLRRSPAWVRRTVYALEWAHVPAVELIMHAQVIVRPFLADHLAAHRGRVLAVGGARLAFFALLAWASPWALLWYALAYVLMIQVLHLGDAFAHTFDAYFVGAPDEPVPGQGRDREWELAHTYSNLVSTRWPALNLLNLNFGYHKLHHDRASVPWHRLPAAHRERYGDRDPQTLPWAELWRTLHRNRLRRILCADYGGVGAGPGRADGFVGAHGVSFLSIV